MKLFKTIPVSLLSVILKLFEKHRNDDFHPLLYLLEQTFTVKKAFE